MEQNDRFVGELTTRETLDFAARCQGGGRRAGEANCGMSMQMNAAFPSTCLRCQTLTKNWTPLWCHYSNVSGGNPPADELAELQALEQKQSFEPDAGLDAFLQAEALTGQHSHIATVSCLCLCLCCPPLPLLERTDPHSSMHLPGCDFQVRRP